MSSISELRMLCNKALLIFSEDSFFKNSFLALNIALMLSATTFVWLFISKTVGDSSNTEGKQGSYQKLIDLMKNPYSYEESS